MASPVVDIGVLPRRSSVSIRDICAIADRLEAWSNGVILRDFPMLKKDMTLAAKSLRGMTRSFHGSDLVEIEP
jgi:hypothetical protein